MTSSRKKWGFITVGLVAALSLGAIGVAGAATTKTATPSPSASAKAGGTHTPDGDRAGHTPDGDHAGHGGHGRGGGDVAKALANLTKTSVSDIMTQRAAGTSFASIAQAKGISTEALLAEATKLETAELDAAVKAGYMTAAERTQILAGLQAHLQEELTETHALPGDGGHDCDGSAGGPGANGTNGTASPSVTPSASGAALTF